MQPLYMIESQIAVKKQMLAATDYQAIKFAEGLLTEEEFAETKSRRETWRAEINQLEEERARNYPEAAAEVASLL